MVEARAGAGGRSGRAGAPRRRQVPLRAGCRAAAHEQPLPVRRKQVRPAAINCTWPGTAWQTLGAGQPGHALAPQLSQDVLILHVQDGRRRMRL